MGNDLSNTQETQSTLSPVNVISRSAFRMLSEIVYRESGIFLTDQKRVMLSSRVGKRLRATGCRSFEEYIEYLSDDDNRDEELVYMVDAVTTNKTDFYREKHHFEFLSRTLLPTMSRHHEFTALTPFRVWSAGCSTGQEPYTLAFELAEYFGGDTSKFRVLATDLSTQVLNHAIKGIYSEENFRDVPKSVKLKYTQQGAGQWQEFRRVVPSIRKTVSFGKLNLMDGIFGLRDRFHAIFFRNVMIYFDQQTRVAVIDKLSNHLLDRCYLFLGHSETLNQVSDKFEQAAQTVYRKKAVYNETAGTGDE